jgi:glycosyltransferase involved in cell wall biosynthesis
LKLDSPFFTIIIPTYSRPKQLNGCLESLTRLEYPQDRFEVLVVDDGSPISLDDVVGNFSNLLNIVLLVQSNSGPGSARNAGALQAKGQFVAFTDDDCRPVSTWLKNLASRFAEAPEHAIGGRTINTLPQNPFSTASQMLIDYLYDYYNADPYHARFIASNNLAFPAELFRQIGGFDNRFKLVAAEDRELCDRWLYHGYQIMYAPEVVVEHAHDLEFPTFCRQHFNYGRGALDFHRARASRNQSRVKLEPFSFYSNLLRYPFSKLSGRTAMEISILLGLSQSVNAAGFFWAVLRKSNNKSA